MSLLRLSFPLLWPLKDTCVHVWLTAESSCLPELAQCGSHPPGLRVPDENPTAAQIDGSPSSRAASLWMRPRLRPLISKFNYGVSWQGFLRIYHSLSFLSFSNLC